MSKSNKFDINQVIVDAHERSYERAFETAVRTGTALVFSRNGKVVEVKPPFRYELVPIKPAKTKRSKRECHNQQNPGLLRDRLHSGQYSIAHNNWRSPYRRMSVSVFFNGVSSQDLRTLEHRNNCRFSSFWDSIWFSASPI